jgi:hypothetical protein
MEIDDAFVKQLAELGFIAGGYGLLQQTDAIVGALEVLRPASERPAVIQATSRLFGRDAAGAERILRERALAMKPDSALALAWLGLALHLQGRASERDQVLNQVLAAGDADENVRSMAQRLITTPVP